MQPRAGAMLGPYRIEAPIGAGGMGAVWKARDTRLDRTVAIKTIEGHFSERFEREAKTIASLNHSHICTLFDVGENYLVMEYIEGAPLKGPLPVAEVVRLGSQIAEALDAAHRKGITHRDLKPANILVTKSGGVKVIDFGLAKGGSPVRGEQDVTLTKPLTGEGTILGTIPYMSPEQLQGHEADARSDIFALGCVLYEMLTGRRAFEGKSQVSIMAAILEHEPAPLTEPVAPVWLDRIIRRSLRKNPDDRWQNARDIAIELRDPPPPPTAGATQSKRSWGAVAALAAAVMGVWALLHFRGTASPEPPRLLQFPLNPPGDGRIQDGPGFAVSADGRQIAFLARDGGKQELWVRSFAASAARKLPGTEGAESPFWSPDGRSLGYFAGGAVMRIAADGGAAPGKVCDLPRQHRGGAWLEDGFMVVGQTSMPLSRVPAAGGGTPTPIASLEPGATHHAWPQVLPGGRLLYWVRSASPTVEGAYAISLATPQSRVKLLSSPVNAIYAPGGGSGKPEFLLWMRDRVLVAQTFDSASLTLSGDPMPVAERVAFSRTRGTLNVSASTSGLLAFGISPVPSRLVWRDLSSQGQEEVSSPEMDGADFMRLSPDGQRVILSRPGAGDFGNDLWVGDLQRKVAVRLTAPGGREAFAVWSPDSQWVIYADGSPLNLHVKRASTPAGDEQRLTQSAQFQYPTDWSRDARHIAYFEIGPEGSGDIWMLPVTPGAAPDPQAKPWPYLRTAHDERQAAFSPEPSPRWVAYQSSETGRAEVYVQTFPRPGSKWRISTAGGRAPRWMPDGREILYVDPAGILMSVPVQLGADSVKLSPPRALLDLGAGPRAENGVPISWDVDPSGKRVLVLGYPLNGAVRPMQVIDNWPLLLTKGSSSR